MRTFSRDKIADFALKIATKEFLSSALEKRRLSVFSLAFFILYSIYNCSVFWYQLFLSWWSNLFSWKLSTWFETILRDLWWTIYSLWFATLHLVNKLRRTEFESLPRDIFLFAVYRLRGQQSRDSLGPRSCGFTFNSKLFFFFFFGEMMKTLGSGFKTELMISIISLSAVDRSITGRSID